MLSHLTECTIQALSINLQAIDTELCLRGEINFRAKTAQRRFGIGVDSAKAQ